MSTHQSDASHPIDGRLYAAAGMLAVMFASLWVMPAVLTQLVREPFGLDNASTSLFFQIGSLASILIGITIGLISDRLGRRVPLIVMALGLGGVCTSLLPHLPRYDLLLGVRFLDSAFGTIAITLLMTRGVDLSTVATRSRSMAVIMMAIPAGYLLGPVMVLALGHGHLGWLFAALGLLQVIGAVVAARELTRRESITPMAPTLAEIGRVIVGLPRTWLPMLFGMVDKFSFAAIALLTPLFLSSQQVGIIGVSLILGLFNLAFILTNPLAGRLVAVWGPRPTVVGASILYGIAFILMGSTNSLVIFALLMMACGVLTAFQFVPNMTLVGDLSGVTHRATIMSVFNTLGSVAMLVGFATLGTMSDTSYAAAYRLTGILEIGCGVIGLTVLTIAYARRRQSRPEMPTQPVALQATPRP